MKKLIVITIFILSILDFANAQDTNQVDELEIGGYMQSDQRFLYKDANPWIWNENRLNLEIKKSTDSYQFLAQMWFRNFGVPQYNNMAALYNKGILQPWDFELKQLYVKSRGFLLPSLDLTLGKQIVSWGTADKINTTSNINPCDFEDILDFGRKRGVWAINAEYFFAQNYKLQAVFLPFFEPANLPVGVFGEIFMQNISLPTGLKLYSFADTLAIPNNKLEETFSAAAKFKATFSYIDFSVSYVYGFDPLPQPVLNTIRPVDMMGNVDVTTMLSYTRQHFFGIDAVSSVGGANVWAEIVAILPTKDVVMTTDVSALYPLFSPVQTIDSTLIESKNPYYKYTIGADYFFNNGFYLNVQYNHGFLHERGKKELNDYLIVRFEKSLFYDKLKLIPIQGAFVVSDWKNLKESYTYVYMPEIIYKPSSNIELSLLTSIIDGKGESMFSKIKNFDAFMMKLKFNF